MSKPRRPKYQHRVAQPAPAPAESVPATSEPAFQETAPSPVDTAPPAYEAPAEFQDTAFHNTSFQDTAFQETFPEPVAPPAESLPAQVEDIATTAANIPAAALKAASPRLLGAESFGTTVMNYFLAEGEAFAAHMRALAGARSMAEFVRLQIGEYQRAADSTLTCWGMLTMSASRSVAAR